jgi:SAM-dependent methyltransferase
MLALLRKTLPDVEALAGTAESIPLADDSVDVVTVAQAFHWFRHAQALQEIDRVLHPGGHLVLVANNRPPDDPIHAALTGLLARYKGDTPRRAEQRWPEIVLGSGLFRSVAERHLSNPQLLGPGGLVERFHSTSFIAALPEEERERALAEVRELEAGLPAPIVLPYDTELLVYASE